MLNLTKPESRRYRDGLSGRSEGREKWPNESTRSRTRCGVLFFERTVSVDGLFYDGEMCCRGYKS